MKTGLLSFIDGVKSLARYAENKELNESSILPTMDAYMAYVEVARSIAKKAIELNLVRRKYSDNELYDAIHSKIAYQGVLMRKMIKRRLAGDYQPNTQHAAVMIRLEPG